MSNCYKISRITALNVIRKEDDIDIGNTSTREAQETIAESEFLRAMKIKCVGKVDLAFSIINDLLKTDVLNKISMHNQNDKLWAIRYNCHKNIARALEEKNEMRKALEHYVLAIIIDESDVYTMIRLGQLALNLKMFEIAEFAFHKCLKRNPNHCTAASGILKVLCYNKNIIGAFGWALKIHSMDSTHKLAINILFEISKIFSDVIPFYKQIWDKHICITKPLTGNIYEEMFKIIEFDLSNEKSTAIQIDNLKIRHNDLKIKNINWLSIGKYIIFHYNQLNPSENSIKFIVESNDFHIVYDDFQSTLQFGKDQIGDINYADKEQRESYTMENKDEVVHLNQIEITQNSINKRNNVMKNEDAITNKQHHLNQINLNPEDTYANLKNYIHENNKPKSRRRCSDLHFLEQWSWHKNRRYSSRKRNKLDQPPTDTTMKGFLTRVFSKHSKPFFDKSWPFKDFPNSTNFDELLNAECCIICNGSGNYDNFYDETSNGFHKFVTNLRMSRYDLLLLTYNWLEYLSTYWELLYSEELKTTYLIIFAFYTEHVDLFSWNHVSKDNLIATYHICLLFLELEYNRIFYEKCEIGMKWKNVIKELACHVSCTILVTDKNYKINMMRLLNMEYRYATYENNLEKSIRYLQKLECLIDQQPRSFMLHMPNLKDSCLSKQIIIASRIAIQRKISLNKVPKLFEENKWYEIIVVICDSLVHPKIMNHCKYWMRDLKTQFEVLLQSFWIMSEFTNCLIWAEMCLHYVVNKYLNETDNSDDQTFWTESVNYILAYIESLILQEGNEILDCLHDKFSRLIQNIINILSFLFDNSHDKDYKLCGNFNIKQPWVVLHQAMLREENLCMGEEKSKVVDSNIVSEEIENVVPNSLLVLFTAHDFLGKRQCCTRNNGTLLHYILDIVTPNLRAPCYDQFRNTIREYLEQVTYCLYGFPSKKARFRHIEDHESNPNELTLKTAMQLFDLYRPERLPEFNSYKLESVSADMEQLLIKIVSFITKEINTSKATYKVLKFINGKTAELPNDSECIKLPYKISCIYYLLADYYFKSRDFSKTFTYYILDLASHPYRLDSWAGLALSKANKIESKLNDFSGVELNCFLEEVEDTIRCFEQCINLNRTQTLLWIEYGSFCYAIHAFYSRQLQHLLISMNQHTTKVEERKEKMLNIAFNCFSSAATLQHNWYKSTITDQEIHEEKWLCQYMLGKISEKRKERPTVYINFYLMAAHYLYESNATYPIKINHNNPTHLSVEGIEIFYRTNSAIIKFLERGNVIDRETGDFFMDVLRKLSKSSFAFNKAKLDDNSLNVLKRKYTDKSEEFGVRKKKFETENHFKTTTDFEVFKEKIENMKKDNKITICEDKTNMEMDSTNVDYIYKSPPSKTSEESTGYTTASGNSNSLCTNSSETSNTESESCSDIDTERTSRTITQYSEEEIIGIYKIVVQNLEECVTRFSEHYKSIYRLCYHYMNAPYNLKDLDCCEQLLLGQYRTGLGNQINGIFFDRKSSNIFNGIWRIPSSEIDRPGSFSAHLSKCVAMLIQILMKKNNYKLLVDVGLQLYKTPEIDKRYIKDKDRLELCQQSIICCVQSIRDVLRKNTYIRNNDEILCLLIDIYKIYKKCIKFMNQKEPLFIQLLIETYQLYIYDKAEQIPGNLSILDLAIRLCLQEIALQKNLDKNSNEASTITNHDGIKGITDALASADVTEFPLDTTDKSLALFKLTNNSNSNAIIMDESSEKLTSSIGFEKLFGEYLKNIETDQVATNKGSPLKHNTPVTLQSYLSFHTVLNDFKKTTNYSKFQPLTSRRNLLNNLCDKKKRSHCFNAVSITCSSSDNGVEYSTPSILPDDLPAVFQPSTPVGNLKSSFHTIPIINYASDWNSLENTGSTKVGITGLPSTKHIPFYTEFKKSRQNESHLQIKVEPKSKQPSSVSYSKNCDNQKTVHSPDVFYNTDDEIKSISNVNRANAFITAGTDLLKTAPTTPRQIFSNIRSTIPAKLNATGHLLINNVIPVQQSLISNKNPINTQSQLDYQIDPTSLVMLTTNNSSQETKKYSSISQDIVSCQTSYSKEFKKSPHKTLQHKLAERQRVNKQNDSNKVTSTKFVSGIDVIILD